MTDAAPGPAPAPVRTIGPSEVQKLIPHRYPFLLVDTVDILEEGKRACGTKCVTFNEPFFQGHFPGTPIMPGVLILEALAQTACVMVMATGGYENKIAFFLGIDGAKFRNPVLPGSVLKLCVEATRLGGRAGRFTAQAMIGGKIAAEAEMSFVLADRERKTGALS
ncbi:MAG: 3-hydroxyacyl-[acyl-carrier-protein] dehydratase FabZ [Elusimicrobia bacterium GWA2_69_24]|nr:MAG: 3-hydroxyacyl-[acyl-carrier-protein] dehydratase FabZ [Elusimicrobia bacterium GWA2_69_24]HBL18975.1 3-hydroxyacyl-[acyl-carrier-protein] dehydratase FabZ [Elusimicrobiota bacterium]